MDTVYKEISIQKADDKDTYRFIASDESTDGHGDRIIASGWDLRRYKQNPIVLFGHDHMMPVGFSPKVGIENKRLVQEIRLARKGTSEFIDTLRELVDQDIVRTVSVGFRVTREPQVIRDKDDNITGFQFDGTELLETSLVSVPANANALRLAKSWGTSERTLSRLFAPDALVQRAMNERKLQILKARRCEHV